VNWLRQYVRTVGSVTSVLLGVAAVLVALSLIGLGVDALIHSLHHSRQPPVVTVTTDK
jgi:hypothetical protein